VAETIQSIFIDPPIAIARLGGSNAPQEAFEWVETDNPRTDGNTAVAPRWSLDVLSDGMVEPRLPQSVRLRDGELIKPVAPFFEVWAVVGNSTAKRSTWRDVRLTPALLRAAKVDESALTLAVEAQNHKAARRTRNPDLVYGATLAIRGDDHRSHTLLASSPKGVARPMIPKGRNIPLGSIQIMKSRPQPDKKSGIAWVDLVNVEVCRFRFTPGRGRVFGPRAASIPSGERRPAVEANNAFLDAGAGWYGIKSEPTIEPQDTYDAKSPSPSRATGESLGVVDDTCEARIQVSLALPGRTLVAHANVFVGPPDFAPDRRAFYSLADDLGDRGAMSALRNKAMTTVETDAWVEDLFERIYETVSLFNLDRQRESRHARLRASEQRDTPINDHGLPAPLSAMGSFDKLRNEVYEVTPKTAGVPLPLSEFARARHASMQDIDNLRVLIAEDPDRLRNLIRRPFEVLQDESDSVSTMRMPPFMRQSNAFPLTLTAWQYDLLMAWVASVARKTKGRKRPKKVTMDTPPRISREASDRREAVLSRIRWKDGA